MKNSQLFSRRTNAAVDFRPDDPAGSSPFAQLRRLSAWLKKDVPPADDISDCDEALNYLREYSYRKLFPGTSHPDFVQLDKDSPSAIDWLLAVHETESERYRATQKKDRT